MSDQNFSGSACLRTRTSVDLCAPRTVSCRPADFPCESRGSPERARHARGTRSAPSRRSEAAGRRGGSRKSARTTAAAAAASKVVPAPRPSAAAAAQARAAWGRQLKRGETQRDDSGPLASLPPCTDRRSTYNCRQFCLRQILS